MTDALETIKTLIIERGSVEHPRAKEVSITLSGEDVVLVDNNLDFNEPVLGAVKFHKITFLRLGKGKDFSIMINNLEIVMPVKAFEAVVDFLKNEAFDETIWQ
jgi:hypothetical protein